MDPLVRRLSNGAVVEGQDTVSDEVSEEEEVVEEAVEPAEEPAEEPVGELAEAESFANFNY
tara:strand:- start:3795 stop:3977 length:183 start_codon:yes stop_codon:yes gene_type:complete